MIYFLLSTIYIYTFYTIKLTNIIGNGTQKEDCSDGDLRLRDGQTDYEGRIEVCINKVWGTICGMYQYYYWLDWSWYQGNDITICRILGYGDLGMLKLIVL